MKKILEVFTKTFECGGEETIVFNLFKNMDKEDLDFTFMTQYNGKNEEFRNEILKQGGKFIAVEGLEDNYIGKIIFFRKLAKELKKSKFDVIHIHSGNIIGFVLGMLAVRKSKNSYIILHSHNSGFDTFKNKILKKLFNRTLLRADKYLACSKEAAIAKFPKKVIDEEKFEIIKNGIELESYQFDLETRQEVRKNLDIADDELLMGFVGRLEDQKNPLFLLELLEKMISMRPNARLAIIGDGSLKEQMKEICKIKNLEDRVLFLGERKDVPKLMQAFDLLLLPSKYEGLGIVVIEAQAASLPVFVSENVPEEGNITELFNKISLQQTQNEWCETILNKTVNNKRISREEQINQSAYNIKDSSNRLKEIYLKMQ